jgi:hypothetical protein
MKHLVFLSFDLLLSMVSLVDKLVVAQRDDLLDEDLQWE